MERFKTKYTYLVMDVIDDGGKFHVGLRCIDKEEDLTLHDDMPSDFAAAKLLVGGSILFGLECSRAAANYLTGRKVHMTLEVG